MSTHNHQQPAYCDLIGTIVDTTVDSAKAGEHTEWLRTERRKADGIIPSIRESMFHLFSAGAGFASAALNSPLAIARVPLTATAAVLGGARTATDYLRMAVIKPSQVIKNMRNRFRNSMKSMLCVSETSGKDHESH